ncbi:MAG: GNAT family N-acetyltransferase [Hyphomicrobiales bacterium]|nr:GNAT family N-acetyltransferase [Hyphomicrobiales bacterium]
MSAIAERDLIAEAPAPAGEASLNWRTELVALDEVRDDWLALEAHGLATPYQRYDWVKAYAQHVLGKDGAALRIVRVRSAGGRTLAMLPFASRRRKGLTTASFVGGKHANFHMGLYDPVFAARLDEPAARQMLRNGALAMGGVDAFILHCQPVSWNGVANPLARIDAQASPSQGYRLPLLPDCDATLANSMSSHARKKHKNKRARFAELGPSRLLAAGTEAERARILDAFFRQKALRFAQMNIADPFSEPSVRRFLTQAAADGAVELAALELNDTLVATYIGAVHHGRFSGMATSFEPDPAIMKVSPGEILLVELIRTQCRKGLSLFDLGVGEARYKATICNETEELVDSFVAITPKGHLAASASRQLQRIKRAIKASPLAFGLMARLRKLGPVRPRPSGEAE